MVSLICQLMLFIKFGIFLAIMSLHVVSSSLCSPLLGLHNVYMDTLHGVPQASKKKFKAKEHTQHYAADDVRSGKIFPMLGLSLINFLIKIKHITT